MVNMEDIMHFLYVLFKYRIYFLVFELSFYPTLYAFRKWKQAEGDERKERRSRLEVIAFFSIVFYFIVGGLTVWIIGLEDFRSAAWMAVLAKLVFMPVVLLVRWVLSKTTLRDKMANYVRGRSQAHLIEMDVLLAVIPGAILYFIMLPFVAGAIIISIILGLVAYRAYVSSLRVREKEQKTSIRQTLRGMWQDHKSCLWSAGIWFMIYVGLGGSSKMTYLLPLLVFIPFGVWMELNIKKANKVDEHEKTTNH